VTTEACNPVGWRVGYRRLAVIMKALKEKLSNLFMANENIAVINRRNAIYQ
jgi:hypothetical protein